jgi:hypothetical protein
LGSELTEAVVGADADRLAGKVDVSPSQRDKLAAAQPGHRRGQVDRRVLLAGGGAHECIHLLAREEVVVARVADLLALDARGRVVIDPAA